MLTPEVTMQVPWHKAQKQKFSCRSHNHLRVLGFVQWQTLKTVFSFTLENCTHIHIYAHTHTYFHIFFSLCSSFSLLLAKSVKFQGKLPIFCLRGNRLVLFLHYSEPFPKSSAVQESINGRRYNFRESKTVFFVH